MAEDNYITTFLKIKSDSHRRYRLHFHRVLQPLRNEIQQSTRCCILRQTTSPTHFRYHPHLAKKKKKSPTLNEFTLIQKEQTTYRKNALKLSTVLRRERRVSTIRVET